MSFLPPPTFGVRNNCSQQHRGSTLGSRPRLVFGVRTYTGPDAMEMFNYKWIGWELTVLCEVDLLPFDVKQQGSVTQNAKRVYMSTVTSIGLFKKGFLLELNVKTFPCEIVALCLFYTECKNVFIFNCVWFTLFHIMLKGEIFFLLLLRNTLNDCNEKYKI